MTHRLRTVTAVDIPALVPLLNSAYGHNPAFEARVRLYSALEPQGWVMLDGPSAPAGVGGFVRFGRCAYIGLMGVSPDAQRRGIGGALFEEILRRCEAAGAALLLLDASEAGAPLYERYAFRDHGEALSFTLDPGVARPADDAGDIRIGAIDPTDEAVVTEVARLDAHGYGADRSSLVRACLHGARARAFGARDPSGELVGYAIGQRRSLGPCVARSTEVARALAGRTLGLSYDGSVTWLVPSQNPSAIDIVRSLGGVPARRLRHMRRGDASVLASDWETLFAKQSFAVG
jgi:GNAT superfamily N-acetyltransferase